MKLVWVSRHELTQKNHEILKRAFGNVDIVQFKDTVQDVRDLKAFADQHGAAAYVLKSD